MIVRSACLSLMVIASAPVGAHAASADAPASSRHAALGDVAPFRSITADVLTLADKGDIAAAQKRGTDLETAWDNAEDKLKPTDPTRWRVVDKAIDRVLAELRAGQPQQPKITAALHDLLAAMDKGGAA